MLQPRNTRRILLITRNLPPLLGGMERMMQQLATGISEYADLTVIGPYGCKHNLPSNITVHETSASLAPFLLNSTVLAVQACRKKPFDLVIGGSGLIGPTLRLLAIIFRCRTMTYLHGLDLVVNSLIYQTLFVASLRHISSLAVNSKNTRDLAIDKGIDERRISIVNPGANLPPPAEHAKHLEFRQRHAIPFERYMVFTGRMTRRKGLSSFLRHTLPIILKSEPDIGLVVVGEDPQNSLNRLGEQAEIYRQLSAQNLQGSVFFVGKLTDSDLELCYADAALQILPLVHVDGDIEGFGMVAIEAAACGTPTVAFDLGGVADAISEENGYLVPAGEFAKFADTIIKLLKEGEPNAEQCRAHAQRFTWQHYNEKMRAMIDGSPQI